MQVRDSLVDTVAVATGTDYSPWAWAGLAVVLLVVIVLAGKKYKQMQNDRWSAGTTRQPDDFHKQPDNTGIARKYPPDKSDRR